MQVRRTDKSREAKPIDLKKYIAKVESIYEKLEKVNNKSYARHIYLATDDPAVWEEANNM